MTPIVNDIIKIMELIAPRALAEDWDNVGLQVGDPNQPVKKIWIALDPLPDVVDAACIDNADLLITHHPLIFKPLNAINVNSSQGLIIHKSIQNRMAIFSAHTNLDKTENGINDILANSIGLNNLKVMQNASLQDIYKLVVFAPVDFEAKILECLFEAKAGQIGNYSCCSFRTIGKGTFKPGLLSNPYIGKINEIVEPEEIRIETVLHKKYIKAVLSELKKVHPYETIAYDLYPILWSETNQGLGRTGQLDNCMCLADFALKIRKDLGLEYVRFAGRADLDITHVAVCCGSGSGLLNDFLSSNAQVYVSGDMGYHNARDVEAADRGLIDIGHFASEHLIVENLAKRLEDILAKAGINVNIHACSIEKEPFSLC